MLGLLVESIKALPSGLNKPSEDRSLLFGPERAKVLQKIATLFSVLLSGIHFTGFKSLSVRIISSRLKISGLSLLVVSAAKSSNLPTLAGGFPFPPDN